MENNNPFGVGPYYISVLRGKVRGECPRKTSELREGQAIDTKSY